MSTVLELRSMAIVAVSLYAKVDTRDVIIYDISIDSRVEEELCAKHRLTTDRTERRRILHATEDNARLLEMRILRNFASFMSSWQITHTTWSCLSGTMQFFNERSYSYS